MGSKAKLKPMRKERENRADTKVDNTFHPFTITPESCGTAVLLLDSEEPEILCQTLRAIAKFAAQDKVNCVQLFNLGAIDMVIKHVQHGVLNVLRFALQCLALMCQLPSGPERVLEDPQNLRKFALMISKMEDVFVLEFSSLVLAELTREPLGCEQLLNCNILSNLFARMKNSLDPDVQKNCLQILCNLLNDPVSAGEVTKNPNFSWSSLLILLNSKFLAIQHAALRTVEQLISRYKDVIIQRSFKASTGLTDLTDILDSYEFRDIHAVVLRVLRNYVETEESAEHLFQSGAVLRLLDYLEMALPAMKPHCLAVLTKMSYSVSGRDALFQTGTDLVFCHQLLSSNVDLLADAALGVANMTKLLPSAVRMSDTNVIEALCAILTDDSAIWFYVRMNALRALVELCFKIPKAAYSLVEPKTFNALRTINKRFKDNPIEAQRLAVECYMSLETYEASARAMATREFILELLTIFQRPDTSLRVLTANVLAGLMTAEGVREFFSKGGGEKILSENLMEEQVELRNALCNLIIASISDEGADTYLELGTLHYMITNRVARYTIPFWEGAIEVIFRHHPAAKLAYTGMLDIQDFTREGFYVQKRLDEIFPSIKQARQCDPPFENPVFYVSFAQAAPEFQARATFRRTITAVIEGSPPSAAREKGLDIPYDPSLRDYLAKLLLWLGDPSKSLQYIEYEDAHFEAKYRDKCDAVSTTLRFRAELLGEFVADQMSGLTQERDCSLPCVDLHLADLMIALGTRVIGLGHVRCGGALERAVLYKVLADRIALPCALYRGTGGHAWVEVAIPEADPDDPLDHKNAYPVGLLRSNYVVDLMKHPGRLLRAGCHDASAITGQRPRQPYVARKLPEICRCAAVHSVRLTIPSSQSTAPLGSTASPAGC